MYSCPYFNSSTELEKSTEQVLPGREGVWEWMEVGTGGRDDPNNVCTCE
jgi:hypothetical protein